MWTSLGVLSFVGGAILINGASMMSVTYSIQPFCFGLAYFCPVPVEYNWTLVFLALGGFFVFLAYPLVLMGSDKNPDEPLIWNRGISGVSLMLAGVVVTLFGAESFGMVTPFEECSELYGCPGIFSPTYYWSWIQTILGIALVLIGARLYLTRNKKNFRSIEIDPFSESDPARGEQESRSRLTVSYKISSEEWKEEFDRAESRNKLVRRRLPEFQVVSIALSVFKPLVCHNDANLSSEKVSFAPIEQHR
jgi:hypothetical protein